MANDTAVYRSTTLSLIVGKECSECKCCHQSAANTSDLRQSSTRLANYSKPKVLLTSYLSGCLSHWPIWYSNTSLSCMFPSFLNMRFPFKILKDYQKESSIAMGKKWLIVILTAVVITISKPLTFVIVYEAQTTLNIIRSRIQDIFACVLTSEYP